MKILIHMKRPRPRLAALRTHWRRWLATLRARLHIGLMYRTCAVTICTCRLVSSALPVPSDKTSPQLFTLSMPISATTALREVRIGYRLKPTMDRWAPGRREQALFCAGKSAFVRGAKRQLGHQNHAAEWLKMFLIVWFLGKPLCLHRCYPCPTLNAPTRPVSSLASKANCWQASTDCCELAAVFSIIEAISVTLLVTDCVE